MPAPQVDALHFLVGPHFGGRAAGNQLAAVEHDHAAGVAKHHVHVMFGEQHAEIVGLDDLGGKRHQRDPFLRRHAGGGFVHQQ